MSEPNMSDRPHIFVVADYGQLSDLAFGEVKQRLYHLMGDANPTIDTLSVPAFDTVATGFVLAQLGFNSKLGPKQFFYVNTAPRKDDLSPREKCAGEGLAYVRMPGGAQMVVVNSGFSLSFLKEGGAEIKSMDIPTTGSQFRSRDIFPMALQQVMTGDLSNVGDDVSDEIPDVPEQVVCYTDGYGNLKCSVHPDALDDVRDTEIAISIGGHTHVARVTDDIFSIADGRLCFSSGSSGWDLPDGTRRRFVECVLRGGSASDMFGRPGGGSTVTWEEVGG